MGLIDWLIIIVPVSFVIYMGIYSRKYVRSVVDFLSAGRVCGRYVICVADIANALSIISLVAYVEVSYRAGFTLSFWYGFTGAIGILLSLFGYCVYRFRETKAMSMGQFLEMRYNRSFRIFAASLRSLSEMLANMIMPAIAARFFIYFLDLPTKITLFGMEFSSFMVLMAFMLTIAVMIIYMGGTLALVVTDSIQGMICYPLLVVFIIYVLYKFSWSTDIMPVLMDRVKGESFINPYDISKLRDFNLTCIAVSILTQFLHKASWIGGGNTTAARNAHEQKMAGMLGAFRTVMVTIFYLIVAVMIITVMNSRRYAPKAGKIRNAIAVRVTDEITSDKQLKTAIINKVKAVPVHNHTPGVDKPLSQTDNLDTPVLNAVYGALRKDENGNVKFQEFRTLYHQMMMAMTMRRMLPTGLLGMFCLLLVLAMISTDDSRIFSSALTISQDIILPLRKKAFTPKQHIKMLRLISIGVGIFFFLGSSFMAQLDYIQLFVIIMTSLWMGGCGPMLIFGLYSRFGTTAGAFASVISGMLLTVTSILLQRNWADYVYPFLETWGWVDNIDALLVSASAPLNPYVVWKMNPIKFPINSYEIFFITMVMCLLIYCIVSWVTCKEPFNLERMLHRGKYAIDGEKKTRMSWSIRTLFLKLTGITPEYSRQDKITAWALFTYSFIYQLGFIFFGVVIWNLISPWPLERWGTYFLITMLIVPCVIALIATFWFGIGGVADLYRLFRDLKNRTVNPLDDGRVEGHVSVADQAEFKEIESKNIEG